MRSKQRWISPENHSGEACSHRPVAGRSHEGGKDDGPGPWLQEQLIVQSGAINPESGKEKIP
jgi:hypothetical protein